MENNFDRVGDEENEEEGLVVEKEEQVPIEAKVRREHEDEEGREGYEENVDQDPEFVVRLDDGELVEFLDELTLPVVFPVFLVDADVGGVVEGCRVLENEEIDLAEVAPLSSVGVRSDPSEQELELAEMNEEAPAAAQFLGLLAEAVLIEGVDLLLAFEVLDETLYAEFLVGAHSISPRFHERMLFVSFLLVALFLPFEFTDNLALNLASCLAFKNALDLTSLYTFNFTFEFPSDLLMIFRFFSEFLLSSRLFLMRFFLIWNKFILDI